MIFELSSGKILPKEVIPIKSKKNKHQRPNIHTEFALSDDCCLLLADALTFMLNLKEFHIEDEKISYDSANNAEQKLFNRICSLTRGEVRATAKAIDVVLLYLPDRANECVYMETDYPDLLSGLTNNLPVIQQLQEVFQTAVKDLRKMK